MNPIPNIIHQTAKTAEIPSKWRLSQQGAKNLHPDWEYCLWTDKDNDQPVATYVSFNPPIPREGHVYKALKKVRPSAFTTATLLGVHLR